MTRRPRQKQRQDSNAPSQQLVRRGDSSDSARSREQEYAAAAASSPWKWNPEKEAFFLIDKYGREIKAPKEWS